MAFDPDIQHRRSVRLREYDYRNSGAYFVTICTFQRECLFGEVAGEGVRLHEIGTIVHEEWLKTAEMRPNVELDAYVIMPNHFHALIILHEDVGADCIRPIPGTTANTPVGAHCVRPPSVSTQINKVHDNRAHGRKAHSGAPLRRQPGSIGSIVAGFKSATTSRINAFRGNPGCPVWQRNYHEHIVRNEADLTNIRQYISDNPLKWSLDENNPANAGRQP